MTIPDYAEFGFFALLLSFVDAVAAIVITGLSLVHINKMTPRTPFVRRISQVILCCGGVALLVAPFFGASPPEWTQVAAHCSVALLFWDFDRQQRGYFK